MNFKNQFLLSFFLLFYSANAFNITQFLGQYNDFSTFNNYLTQTQLADAINSRQTITILAVDNNNISPISGKPADVLKAIMSVHVILDYYDVAKLQKLPNKTAILTTLFQTSGKATGQQGFLNVTDLATGSVVFGSAAKGATLGANLVKSIAAQPYNISVLQISTVIIPLGIDNSASNSSSPPPSPSPVPAASPPQSPTPVPSSLPVPAASPPESPTPGMSPSMSPAESPAVSPPMPDTPPAATPPQADTPAADSPTADHPSSVGTNLRLSHENIFLILSSALWLVAMI